MNASDSEREKLSQIIERLQYIEKTLDMKTKNALESAQTQIHKLKTDLKEVVLNLP